MPDMDMIIRGCENWIKNHKGEELALKFASVEDLLSLLKEQEAEKKCCRDCEYYGACHGE